MGTQTLEAATTNTVIIIPATQASTVATNAAKKIRRAFSMPRNPFRWSRKFKTTSNSGADSESSVRGDGGGTISSCVGGGRGRSGSIVSLSSYEAVAKDVKEVNATSPKTTTTTTAADNDDAKIVGAKIGNNKQASGNRILRRSSFRKFLNRITQHVSSSVNVGATKQAAAAATQTHTTTATTDRVPPIGGCYQWPADQTPGVMGLKNHGNTCFMNAVLQCLSHTDILAEYFVLDQYKADLKRRNKINSRKFGTKGELTEQLANVLKALWTCKNESDHSTSFKAVVDRYGSQFRSSTQHDAQEFLFWLLDKVHEDLNTATKRRYKSVKNTYGRPDEVIAAETLANHIRCNNSFVQAVFQAQFRSSLTCPRCKKQSNTFDPFHCVSVQLPQLTQQTIFVTVVHLTKQPRQVKVGLRVPAGSPIVALREQLQTDTGIASECMVLVDFNSEGFTRVFYDTQPVATLNGIDTIYCIEVPAKKVTTPIAATTTTTTTSEAGTNSAPSSTSTATTSTTTAVKTTALSHATDLLLLVANVRKRKKDRGTVDAIDNAATPDAIDEFVLERFGTPLSLLAPRDCSYIELQKRLLREMSPLLKPEVFSYATPLTDMFQLRLQDPSADPDTYLEQVEHPLLTEMIDLALSVLSAEAGPAHIKLLLEWSEPEQYFADLTDSVVEHESVARLLASKANDTATLTLEQCLEHYTKAETLSAEDAWRCPHCQQYLPVVKTLGLWSLPDILVVHFKRFRQHHEKGSNAAKLTTMVKFPLNAFDMSPHLARGMESANLAPPSESSSNSFRPSPWKKMRTGDSRSSTLNSRANNETRYDLYAVCYHQGDTLETGHYTAACKNPYDRQWYKFDDQRVSKVPNESIQEEIINNEAYMLFYQRRATDAVESSGSSSNSGDHWVSRIAPTLPAPTQPPLAEKLSDCNAENTEKTKPTTLDQNLNMLEKAETKPVDIPKVAETVRNEVETNDVTEVAANDALPLIQTVVTKQTKENNEVNIDEFDFADADGSDVNAVQHADEIDELKAPETLETNNESNHNSFNAEEVNDIFVMDGVNDSTADVVVKTATATADTVAVNAATNVVTTTSATTPKMKATNDATTSIAAAARLNGYARDRSKSPLNIVTSTTVPLDIKANNTPHILSTAAAVSCSPTSSSSASSLSSRSSPHSLAVSAHGASTLQTKFNGFATANNATTAHNNYKESLLSSSLKSNSGSIIGAALAAHSHEFKLSRQQHWNGSHSSVSAVENATQQTQTQAHCLNLRHSFSTSSNYKLRECSETLSTMLRNTANTCSKDTLIFIDQQNHHHNHHHHHHNQNSFMEDDDDTFMGSRSLWISPVTPHKLITVSPKN